MAGKKASNLPLSAFRDPRRKKAEKLRIKFTGRILAEGLFALIREEEERRGGFFALADDGFTYFYNGETRQLTLMGEPARVNLKFVAYLTKNYGLIHSELVTRQVLDLIDAHTRMFGLHPAVKRFAFYNKDAKILYLSAYDGTCFRLNGKSIELIPNGKEVLFVDDDRGVHVDPDLGEHNGEHNLIIRTIIDDLQFAESTAGGLSPEDQKILLAVWTFALPFAEILPAIPVLLLEGSKGAGKSVALKRIQALVLGRVKLQNLTKRDEEAFGVILLRNPITVLENVDSYLDWLPDALAAYVTGGEWTRRKLYTDTEEIVIKPRAFVAVSTRDAVSFKRDDVADRCIVIRLERREDKGGFGLEDYLIELVQKSRPQLYGEWLMKVNQIISKLRGQNGDRAEFRTTQRMSDFAVLCGIIGNVLGFSTESVQKALHNMQSEREELVVENDSLIPILEMWLENIQNSDRWISAKELFSELKDVSLMRDTEFKYNKPQSLAKRIKNTNQVLKRKFMLDIMNDATKGVKIYKFRNTIWASEENKPAIETN